MKHRRYVTVSFDESLRMFDNLEGNYVTMRSAHACSAYHYKINMILVLLIFLYHCSGHHKQILCILRYIASYNYFKFSICPLKLNC